MGEGEEDTGGKTNVISIRRTFRYQLGGNLLKVLSEFHNAVKVCRSNGAAFGPRETSFLGNMPFSARACARELQINISWTGSTGNASRVMRKRVISLAPRWD